MFYKKACDFRGFDRLSVSNFLKIIPQKRGLFTIFYLITFNHSAIKPCFYGVIRSNKVDFDPLLLPYSK